jgi:hypothetical protein
MTLAVFIAFIVLAIVLQATGMPKSVASKVLFVVIFLTCIAGWGP